MEWLGMGVGKRELEPRMGWDLRFPISEGWAVGNHSHGLDMLRNSPPFWFHEFFEIRVNP